jgi:hypothetical protein
MNIPRFTADESLDRTSGHHLYRMPNRLGTYEAGSVIPQMPPRGGSVFCVPGGCICSSDSACNDMFSEPGLCGDVAYCNENGCLCLF